MNGHAQDHFAAPGQQDIEEHQTATSQSQLRSSTTPDEEITLAMAAPKSSTAQTNGSSTPAVIESTEKSDIPKGVKPRRSRKIKAASTPPPPRRSTRHSSRKLEDEKTASVEKSQSSQASTKSKSRATQNKSPSPAPTFNTTTSNRSNKRKAVEPGDAESLASTHDEENQPSPKSNGTTRPPAKKQKKLGRPPKRQSVSSRRKSSASGKNIPLPVLDSDDENSRSSPVTEEVDNYGPSDFEIQRMMMGYDPLYDPNYVLPPEEDDLYGYEETPPPKSRSASASPSRPPSSASKRKVSESEGKEAALSAHEVNDQPILEVPQDDDPPAQRLRESSSPSIASVRGGGSNAILNEVSDREATDAAIGTPEVVVGVENSPTKKRGRPAGGRPANRQNPKKPATAIKKSVTLGRRKKTSEDAKVQAAYDRMVELKKSYKEIAKGLKPALALLADRTVESMIEDPKAHEKVSAFHTVTTELDSIHNAYLTKLGLQYEFQRSLLENRRNQDDEYSGMQLRDAVRDIFEKTISRAKAAFVLAHKTGTREEVVGDDEASIDGNRDAHLRDLNLFNVPDDVEDLGANLGLAHPGISTPQKSPSKKRGQNDSFDELIAGTAPIAKHSLLAVTQEHESSSMPPSRVATPEAVDNGVFDEHGVHIPNRVRRGRMTEPNNRAIVKSWIEYDEWDIQHEVMASKKKAKNQGAKIEDLIYLDQISFSSQGGGGYRLSTNKPEDFDQKTIKLYGLHPRYGIPTKESTNPDNVVPRTDFSKPLDNTRPIVVIDVEETRPVSPGGTRKPAELSEPLELSRSVPIIYADRDFEDLVLRQDLVKALDAHSKGAGYPSVKGLATYDGVARDEQKAHEAVDEILEANEIIEEDLAKKARAAAAAAAASIAHKSSINAIVNSDDGAVFGGSQASKPSVNLREGYIPAAVPALDALFAAIDMKKSPVPNVPTQSYYPGTQARDFGDKPREYISHLQPPPPLQPYVQQAPVQQQIPVQQQAPLQQHAYLQHQTQVQAQVQQQPPLPYNTGVHSQSQKPLQMHYNNGGAPSLLQHQMMQTLHPQNMAPAVPSPYSRPLQTPYMAPPPPAREYHQFSHYVPPQQRQAEQSHLQSAQPPRSHREIRPAPPQQEPPFYRNASPAPSYQSPTQSHVHYQAPVALTWAQQHQMQQSQQMQQQQVQQAPTQQAQQVPQPQQAQHMPQTPQMQVQPQIQPSQQIQQPQQVQLSQHVPQSQQQQYHEVMQQPLQTQPQPTQQGPPPSQAQQLPPPSQGHSHFTSVSKFPVPQRAAPTTPATPADEYHADGASSSASSPNSKRGKKK